MQRGSRTFGFAFGVEGARGFEGLGVEGHDGVQMRSLIIVGADAGEADLDQFFRGEGAGLEGGIEIGDGGVIEVEGFGGGGSERRAEDKREEQPSPMEHSGFL